MGLWKRRLSKRRQLGDAVLFITLVFMIRGTQILKSVKKCLGSGLTFPWTPRRLAGIELGSGLLAPLANKAAETPLATAMLASWHTHGKSGSKIRLPILLDVPDLKYFHTARLDSVRHDLVPLHGQFADSRDGFVALVWKSPKRFGFAPNKTSQLLSRGPIVRRDESPDFLDPPECMGRPLQLKIMLHASRRTLLPPHLSRTRPGPPQR